MAKSMTSSKLEFAGVVLKQRNKEESPASDFDLVQIEDAINLTPIAGVNLDSISI
jgi:hypothetical protein